MTDGNKKNETLIKQIELLEIELGEYKERERKFRTLLEVSPDILYRSTIDGQLTYISPTIERIAGYTVEESIGMHLGRDMYLHPEDRKTFIEELQRTGKVQSLVNQFKRKDGSVWWGAVSSHFIKDGNGVVRGVEGLVRDVTNDVLASKALGESEERYRALSDASFGGIVIHDQGVIKDCNHGLAVITGYSVDELIGMNGFDLIEPGSLDVVLENVKNGYELSYEVKGVRKNGEIYPLLLRGSIIPYKGSTVRGTEFRDITERKLAEEETLKLEAQLTQMQKLETIGQLAGGVAHDFNNMLGVITGHAEMALNKINVNASVYNDLKQIQKAAGRSAEITRQLLAFARKQTIAPKVLDLNVTLEGMMQMLHRLIGEDIDLVWEPGEDLWLVQIDTTQIDQILANLCVNARDAIEDVGVVTVRTDNSILAPESISGETGLVGGEYVKIMVSDNGCGMDEKTFDHVFEPFFTTKSFGEGTGLGLATVYGTVKQNCGVINILSELGKGTTFEIYLPRYFGTVEETQLTSGPGREGHGTETILLVEDEWAILEMSRQMLDSSGYRVLAANSPLEAISIEEDFAGDIDLLLTDVKMPQMSGGDLAAHIITRRPKIKILYMSGYSADIITKQGVLDEGTCLIQKPFSQQELTSTLRRILEDV